jgi:hypothetical protein
MRQYGASFSLGAKIKSGANSAGQHVGMLHEEGHHVVGDCLCSLHKLVFPPPLLDIEEEEYVSSKIPEKDALVELNAGSPCNVLQGSITSPLQCELVAKLLILISSPLLASTILSSSLNTSSLVIGEMLLPFFFKRENILPVRLALPPLMESTSGLVLPMEPSHFLLICVAVTSRRRDTSGRYSRSHLLAFSVARVHVDISI